MVTTIAAAVVLLAGVRTTEGRTAGSARQRCIDRLCKPEQTATLQRSSECLNPANDRHPMFERLVQQGKSYPPGAAIIREGTPPDNFYIITKGRVDIVLQQPGGSEIVVTTMGVGQYFGEIALLRGGTHNATVRSAEVQLAQAQTNLVAQHDQLSVAKTNAQLQMQQRVTGLTEAQAAYAMAKRNWEYARDMGKVGGILSVRK